MWHFEYTAAFIAPFGAYTDELILSTARSFRAKLGEQANIFSNMEFRIDSDEGVAMLRCSGTDEVLAVEQEVGLYSLHGAIRVTMEVEIPGRAEEALVNAFEHVTAEKGATILEWSSSAGVSKK